MKMRAWIRPTANRRNLPVYVCGLLLLADVARAQATLTAGTYTQDFNSIGASLPTGWNVWTSSTSTGNGTAYTWSTTQIANNASFASGGAFRNLPGASQTWSAGLASGTDRGLGWRGDSAGARDGSITFTLANTTGLRFTRLSFKAYTPNSSGSAATIELQYQIGASGTFTGFSPAVSYTTVATTGAPPLTIATVTLSTTDLAVLNAQSSQVTLRFDNTATTGTSWNTFALDDFIIVATPDVTISTQPASQSVTSGQAASFGVSATGSGTFTYQWRKYSGGTANNISGATSNTLNLGTVTTADATDYDVVISNGAGSVTSSAATLAVNQISTSLAFSNLTATYDGATHAATVTPTPTSGVTTSLRYAGTSGTTYGPSTTPPTNAGTYTVTATITDSEHALSSANTATLTIAQATATVSLSNLAATYDGAAHAAIVTTTPASLANRVTYAGSGTAPTGAGSYAVVATITDPNYSGTASGTLVIAQAAQTISFSSLTSRVTSDPPFTVSATASSGLGVTFSIVAGSPTIATISGSTITLAGGSSTGTVTVRAAQAGNTNYSAAANVDQAFTVSLPSVTITTQPSSQTVIAFQSAAFTVAASVGSGTLTYQWRKGGTAISDNASATTATLTLTNVVAIDAGSYDVVVTAPGGSVTSFPATLTVNPAAATVTLGSLSATYDGAVHAATATTSPGGLAVTFTYNGSAITPSAGGSYTVVGTIADANYSGTATGTLVIGKTAQTITFPAPSGTLRATVPFTVSATASSGLTPVTFSIVSGNATATGTNGATITAADPNAFVVRATQAGDGNYSAASTDLTLTVSTAPAVPSFTVQPTAAATFTVGDIVRLSATVTGVPDPTFQWRKGGAAITGDASATTATLVLSGVALTDAGTYDLVATNSTGVTTSSAVTLTVVKQSQTITFDAPTGPLSAGTAVPLLATASSGLPVSYTIVSGAASIAGNAITSLGASVVVRASQAGNSTTFNAAPSVDRTFTFVVGGTAPFIFSPPLDQAATSGATVTFSAAAIGTPAPTWQWQKDGVALAGATSATLTLASVTLADAARYTAVATNNAGRASASATLIVRAAPAFATSPASQSVFAGNNVTFTAAVTGVPAPTLQWHRNGVAISGAVSNTLTLVAVRAADAARYDVVATNALGTATSDAATLTVTTRDFTGTYFGTFAGAAGNFALHVRADGTAIFLGYLPGLKAGLVTTNVVVDLAGNFSLSFATLSAAAAPQPLALSDQRTAFRSDAQSASPTAAAIQSITLRGTLDDTAGTLAGSVSELSLTLAGTRAASIGRAASQAGFYSGALVGSADGRGYVIVGADGQAFALAASSTAVDGAMGTVGPDGRLTLTTSNQSSIDLGFANGAMNGTVRTAGGATATLDGASDTLAGTERLANLSARGAVTRGAPLIAGFVVTGTTPKQVLIRAAGPALAAAPFNLAGALDDPALRLFRGPTAIAQNDNWSTPAASVTAIVNAAASVGAFAFPSNSSDAALLTTLAPGAYTVQAAGGAASVTDAGIALVEIYEVLAAGELPGTRRLANLSARGPVSPGVPLIAGFVINGTAPQRVLVRGIGPALGNFGVSGTLANPTLTLFRGSTAMKTNDDWFRDADAVLIRDAAATTGAFALGAASLDASMLLYLSPGAHTAQVRASNPNGTGTALVELYETRP